MRKEKEKDEKKEGEKKTPFIDRWIKSMLLGRKEDGYVYCTLYRGGGYSYTGLHTKDETSEELLDFSFLFLLFMVSCTCKLFK